MLLCEFSSNRDEFARATVATSDVGIMSGMRDIGSYRVNLNILYAFF